MWKDAEKYLLKDKYIGPLIKKYGSCTIKPRSKSQYFEDLVDSIVQQQLSIKAARTIYQRIEERLDKVTPENIKRVRAETLRKCGLSYSKASYLKDLADKVLEGELHLNSLDKHTDEEVMVELIAVKGIGRWTAEMFLMFSLARPNIFSVDDMGIVNGIKKMTGRGMDKTQMERFALRWKPYRTVASWYIWRSLEND